MKHTWGKPVGELDADDRPTASDDRPTASYAKDYWTPRRIAYRRKPLRKPAWSGDADNCRWCDTPLPAIRHRNQRFCDAKCRQYHWLSDGDNRRRHNAQRRANR